MDFNRKKIISTDKTYENMLKNYTKADAFLAIGLFLFFILLISALIWVAMNYMINLSFFLFVMMIASTFIIMRIRKQKLNTVGITNVNFLKSLVLGVVCSIPVVIFVVIPRLAAIERPMPLNDIFILSFGFWFLVSFGEELFGRAFLQTRIYALIKSDFWAVFVGGLIFAILHIPGRILSYYSTHGESIHMPELVSNILVWIGAHVILNIMYRKYNSIVAPVILHFFLNFTIVPFSLFF
ncbi:MAG: CPBP family intramembrane metalloprotease [Defluviitaleaceae bacterium]|nr:CPBP family intramembrane metalloprotease [Defluviitaleaceae bacterium]